MFKGDGIVTVKTSVYPGLYFHVQCHVQCKSLLLLLLLQEACRMPQ
jgi:hypothetical protein